MWICLESLDTPFLGVLKENYLRLKLFLFLGGKLRPAVRGNVHGVHDLLDPGPHCVALLEAEESVHNEEAVCVELGELR